MTLWLSTRHAGEYGHAKSRRRRRAMMSLLRQTALIGFLAGVMLPAPDANADDPFYKGKRLTVMVNFAAGGPTDIEGRLFARHIARHIEGQPNLIVQNMDGAGGLVGTSWLGEV